MTEIERKEALTLYFALNGLTHRESEVASLAASGSSGKAMSESLGIDIQTVKFHLTSIYRKLKVKNKRELARQVISLTGG